MKDLEKADAVDRVLAGLRAAEPGEGIDGRILLALEQPESRLGGVRRWGHWQRWLAAGMSVTLVLVPVARRLVHSREAQQAAVVAVVRSVQPASMQADVLMSGGSSAIKIVRSRTSLNVVSVRKKPLVRSAETVACAEAESFPAPLMPLTRQERLLLRMLARPEGVQVVASLDGVAEDARERQQFEQFFAPVYPASSFRHAEAKGDGNRVELAPRKDSPTGIDHTTGEVR